MDITEVLNKMGFEDGWAANHATGIILWLREETQPTYEELIDAGWVPQVVEKPYPETV
jgi:hypothetical protein